MNKLCLSIALATALFANAQARACSAESAAADAKAAADRMQKTIATIKANGNHVDAAERALLTADLQVLRRVENAVVRIAAETANGTGEAKAAHDIAQLTADAYGMVDLMVAAVLKMADGGSPNELLQQAAAKAQALQAEAPALQAMDPELLQAGSKIVEAKLGAAYCSR